MKRVDVVNEFITEMMNLQEQVNTFNNRVLPEFRLGNKDLKSFNTIASIVKNSSEQLENALKSLEEEDE